MSSCNGRNETMEDNYSFENFVKNLGKVFVITTTIVICMALRSRLVTPDSSLFHIAIFILGASFLFTMISILSSSLFKIDGSVCPKNFLFWIASDALDNSSLKKISRSEYSELMTIFSILPVSASNVCV